MTTVEELLAQMTIDLDDPEPSHPKLEARLLKFKDALQYLHNLRGNTSIAWDVADTPLEVQAGEAVYPVTAADFSKDFYIHTEDTSDTGHIQREIRRCDPQDLDQLYSGPVQTAGSIKHSAMWMSFYRSAGGVFVRVTPTPSEAATYRIWYKRGDIRAAVDYNSSPPLPEHSSLLRLRASFACVTLCRWADHDKGEMRQKRADLQKSLALEIQDYEKVYRIAITSDRQESVTTRRLYGDDFEPGQSDLWDW